MEQYLDGTDGGALKKPEVVPREWMCMREFMKSSHFSINALLKPQFWKMLIGTNSLMEAVRFAYGWKMAEIIAGVRHHLAVMGESCESVDHFCLQFNC